MRTIRSNDRPGGVSQHALGEGVWQHALGGGCLPGECLPWGLPRRCLPRGQGVRVWPGGVFDQGRVMSDQGDVWLEGVLSVHAGINAPTWTEWQTPVKT